MSKRNKNCHHCGKDFFAMHMRAKYCSENCRTSYHRGKAADARAANPEHSRDCKGCGTTIKSNDRRKLFCGSSCRYKFFNGLRPTTKQQQRQCPHCGTKFVPNQKRGRGRTYCSDSCRGKAAYIRSRPVTAKERFESRKKHQWGGNWYAALQRDNFTCQLCGIKKWPSQWVGENNKLVVHHLDGTGEHESKNHSMDNLMTLCRPCHHKFHTKVNLVKRDGEWVIAGDIFSDLGIESLGTTSA